MTEQQKNQLQLLNETVDYYKTHHRGVVKNTINVYYDSDTKVMCAIGRLLGPELAEILELKYGGNLVSDIINDKTLDKKLHNEFNQLIEKYTKQFLVELQSFHDVHINWNNGRLSPIGEQSYEMLVDRIKNQLVM